MKTTKKHFDIFKRECDIWIKKLELDDIDIRVSKTNIGKGDAAHCDRGRLDTAVIDIRLNSDLDKEDLATKTLKETARHEIIHALIGEFAALGYNRFVTSSEMVKAEEKLVVKLEKLL